MIKGLADLLKKHGETPMTEAEFEAELNKLLPETHIPKSVFNELNDKHKALQTQNEELNKAIEKAKTDNINAEELKKQIDELNAKHKAELENIANQQALEKKNAYIDNEISKAKGRNAKAIRSLLEVDKVTLSDNGSYLGLNEQLEAIKKDNPYMFEADENEPKIIIGGGSANNNGGGNNNDSYEAKIAEAMGIKN